MFLPRFLLAASVLWSLSVPAAVTYQEILTPDLGRIVSARAAEQPKGLIVLITNETPRAPAGLATALAGLDYLVALVPVEAIHARKSGGKLEQCMDVAAAVLALQRRLVEAQYSGSGRPSIVVGVGAGAVLAYLAASQAEMGQFHAVVSIDFEPVLPVGEIPCVGKTSASTLIPAGRVNIPWFVFQPVPDPKQEYDPAYAFISEVSNARLTRINIPSTPNYRWANSSEFMALMQWLDPHIEHQVATDTALTGLPITEVPAQKPGDDRLMVMISGDGGWAALDRGVSAIFAARGINTVGLDSLSYFWKKRTPEETAAAIADIIGRYSEHWHTRRVLLFGYSFGADVLPFSVNRLPEALQRRIERVVFAGLGSQASFEFHLTNWLDETQKNSVPVLPEVRRMVRIPVICIYGSDEGADSICPELGSSTIVARELPGDHHFNDDYESIANAALE